jgi:hypothetical protein
MLKKPGLAVLLLESQSALADSSPIAAHVEAILVSDLVIVIDILFVQLFDENSATVPYLGYLFSP